MVLHTNICFEQTGAFSLSALSDTVSIRNKVLLYPFLSVMQQRRLINEEQSDLTDDGLEFSLSIKMHLCCPAIALNHSWSTLLFYVCGSGLTLRDRIKWRGGAENAHPDSRSGFFSQLVDDNSLSGSRPHRAAAAPALRGSARDADRGGAAAPAPPRRPPAPSRSLLPSLPPSLPPSLAGCRRRWRSSRRAGWRRGCCCWGCARCSLPAGPRRSRRRGRPAGGGGWAPRRASPSSTTATPSCGRRWWPCGCSAPPSAGSTRWGAAPRAGSSWSSRSRTAPASTSPVRGRCPRPHLCAGNGGAAGPAAPLRHRHRHRPAAIVRSLVPLPVDLAPVAARNAWISPRAAGAGPLAGQALSAPARTNRSGRAAPWGGSVPVGAACHGRAVPGDVSHTAARCGCLGIRGCVYLEFGISLSEGMWLMLCTCVTPTIVSIPLFPLLESMVSLMSACERAYPWKLLGAFGPAISLLQSCPHVSLTALQHRSGSPWLLGGGVASMALRGFGQYN